MDRRIALLVGLLSFVPTSFVPTATAQDWRVREPIAHGHPLSKWIAQLSDADGSVRAAAIAPIGECASSAPKITMPLLLKAAGDPDAVVRLEVAQVFRRQDRGNTSVAFALCGLLRDSDPLVRLTAAHALEVQSAPLAQGPLADALVDSSADVRSAAMRALMTGWKQDASRLEKVFAAWEIHGDSLEPWASALFRRTGDAAVPHAMRTLRHADPKVRLRSLNLLIGTLELTKSQGKTLFRACLNDPDEDVRRFALTYVGGYEAFDGYALQAIAEALDSPKEATRAAALIGLKRYRSPVHDNNGPVVSLLRVCGVNWLPNGQVPAIRRLLVLTDHDNEEVRCAALDALRQFNANERTVDACIKGLDDPSDDVRLQACSMLAYGNAASPKVRNAAFAALHDDNKDVRIAAAQTIGRFSAQHKADVIEALLERIRDDGEVAPTAAAYLAEVEPTGARTIPHLLARLKANPTESETLIASISRFGKDGQETLTKIAEGENLEWATQALAHFDTLTPRRVAVLRHLLKKGETSSRVVALGVLQAQRKKAQPYSNDVLAALDDPAPEVRLQAVHVLRQIDASPAVLQAAIRLTSDASAEVRQHALNLIVEHEKYPPAVIDAMAQLVKNDSNLAGPALTTLRRAGPAAASALPTLLAVLLRDDAISPEVVAALAAIGAGRDDVAAGLAERLRRDLKSKAEADAERFDFRRSLVDALGEIGPKAAAALPSLMDCACDADPSLRGRAVVALGQIGTAAKGAVPLLQARLGDADAEVAIAAKEALEAIRKNIPRSPRPIEQAPRRLLGDILIR